MPHGTCQASEGTACSAQSSSFTPASLPPSPQTPASSRRLRLERLGLAEHLLGAGHAPLGLELQRAVRRQRVLKLRSGHAGLSNCIANTLCANVRETLDVYAPPPKTLAWCVYQLLKCSLIRPAALDAVHRRRRGHCKLLHAGLRQGSRAHLRGVLLGEVRPLGAPSAPEVPDLHDLQQGATRLTGSCARDEVLRQLADCAMP